MKIEDTSPLGYTFHLDNIDRHKLYGGMQYTELRENYFGITPLG